MTDAKARAAHDALKEVIAHVCETHDGIEAAAEALLKAARADEAIYEALMARHERTIAMAAIRSQFAQERRTIFYGSRIADARVHVLAKANAESLMDFPLPGGKRLAGASREEVAAGALYYMNKARDATAKGKWLDRIAEKLPPGATVAQVMSEADLAALKE